MQIAIVGLPLAGKTTVFNALTHGHARTGGYGGLELHVGVVQVPDPRLERLAAIFRPKRIVRADVTFVDLPAPPPSAGGRAGAEELPAEHLAWLREAEALVHVVRAFEDPAVPHPSGTVDPLRDLEQLDLELTFADLAVTEHRLERLAREGRHGTPLEREAAEREAALLGRIRAGLEAGRPVRELGLSADESKLMRGFRYLTEKPVLVLLNVGERDVAREAELIEAVRSRYQHAATLVDALSAKIEMEIGELPGEEAAVFLADLGLAEPSQDRLIALAYRLLGRITFFTSVSDELHAWPIADGSTALDGAAAIHSDLARGFIRAETVTYEDLIALGTLAEARRHGKLRSEGKTYRVRDGDVIEILFKV